MQVLYSILYLQFEPQISQFDVLEGIEQGVQSSLQLIKTKQFK